MSSNRRQAIEAWLAAVLGTPHAPLLPASSDASFRRYWRLRHAERSLIVMDAPASVQDTTRFVHLAATLRGIGLNTPEVLAQDPAMGLVLMSDLGVVHYLDELNSDTSDALYRDALGALIRLQAAAPVPGLPDYDEGFLRREIDLFDEWLLGKLLGLTPTAAERQLLDKAYRAIVGSALEQPRVWVHRDFHSRNLMVTTTANPGILDFQDAVVGPVTYDVVSLLKDCYIAWPPEQVEGWMLQWFDLAVANGILRTGDRGHLERWFDLMGMQRHLKAAGIFARLALRDGKRRYLADLPRTLGYIAGAGERHQDLLALGSLVRHRIMPLLPGATA